MVPGLSPWRIWAERLAACAILLTMLWFGGRAVGRHRARSWPTEHRRLRVLATIFPIYDFTREVAGDAVDLQNLLPPGTDPHEFALSPGDVSLAAGADLILANGAGLDNFVLEALRKAGITQKPVVFLSSGLPLIRRSGPDTPEHHGAGDPHLWLDPVLARIYTERIAHAVISALDHQPGGPSLIPAVRQRAASYGQALANLHRDYAAALAPDRGRSFIAFHAAFAYLARRYGLKVAAVWETVPGREPSPAEVAHILKIARREHVRVLFTEPEFPARAIEMVSRDAGLKLLPLDPVETADDFAAAHYLDAMRQNLRTLVEAFRL
ncbi:MAG: metal ABC transporter substrate-binding protein [Chthonomonadales bacterium]